MTTATTKTAGAIGRLHHIGTAKTETGSGANQATAASSRPGKHERNSLKKLHSLRNQLFCGFKSFTSSSEQEPQYLAQIQAKSAPAKQEPIEVPKISKPDESSLDSAQPIGDAELNKQDLIDCKFMMIVDQNNANLNCGADISGRSSRGSRSSSRTSLSNQRQRKSHKINTIDQENSQLPTSSYHSNEEDDFMLRVAKAGQHGCSFKRASFRRLTGRGSARKQADDEQPKKMIRLIEQLDRFAKSFGENERDDHECRATVSSCETIDDGLFYLEKSWTLFVRLDTNEAGYFPGNHADSDSESKQTARNNLKIQQDAIWELLTSEIFYLKRLRVILNVFLETLAKLQQNSLLLEIDATRLTSNIEEVYLANCAFWTKDLLPMLTKSRLSGCLLDPSAIKDAFIKIRSSFGSYYKYCLEHTACLDYLRDRNKCDQYFKVYLAWCESQKDCERLRLMDLLAKPMQRLTKYPLLLKAIYRKTDDPKQLDGLREMIISMEKFVLTVDLKLRDRDELEQLRSTANRIESLDIGSSDIYCDEVNRMIAQYCRAFDLCKPLFNCSYGCNRRLIFDSSQHTTNHLGQLKFKDSQLNSKLDIVLLLFTDQLVICKQISNRWYANSGSSHTAQERLPVASFKSTVYNKSFSSSRRHNSTKSSPKAGWIKSRSGSGKHLVDSLTVSNDRGQSDKSDRLLSANNSSGSDQQPILFHSSTSSLAGSAAREHFVISKSADGSRSGESFHQSACKPQASSQSSRLKAIRSPYLLDRLVLHELNDGHRIFCCQLNDSGTIAASFVLHIGSATNSETLKSPTKTEQQQQSNNSVSLRQPSSAAIDINRLESDSAMHRLSPLSGPSKRCKNRQQTQISPARKFINLIEQTQLRYRAAANLHGSSLAPVWANKRQEINLEPPANYILSLRREKLDSLSSKTRTSSISRSSELLELGNQYLGEREDNSLDIAFHESDSSKATLEQEQSMLLKHGKYDELHKYRLDGMLGRRQLSCNLEPTATGTFVSPLLSVSIDEPRMLHVPNATSQNSVFEADYNSGRIMRNVDSQTDSQLQDSRMIHGGMERTASDKTDPESVDYSSTKTTSIERDTSSSPACNEHAIDRRQGQSWSRSHANRRPLVSISGSDIESTSSDISPLARRYLNPDLDSPIAGRQRSIKRNNNRRQVNHLRRQNDIISFSHDQQENLSSSSLQFSRAYDEPSMSADEPDSRQLNSSAGHTNNDPSFESSQNIESIPISSLNSQHRRYLSLARRLMQDQNSSSQATTMDQASLTLNDNQTESLDSEETRTHSRGVSIESGNLKARSVSCVHAASIAAGQENHRSICRRTRELTEEQNDDPLHLNESYEHDTTTKENRDSPKRGESLERGRVYLKIPSRIQQVDDKNCGRFGLKSSSESVSVICDHADKDNYGWDHQVTQSNTPNKTDRVSVPVLNVTTADSHLTKQDFNESHPDVSLGSLTYNICTTNNLENYARLKSGDYMQRLNAAGDPPFNRHHQQTSAICDPRQDGEASLEDEDDSMLEVANCGQLISTNSLDRDCIARGRRNDAMVYGCTERCPRRPRANDMFDEDWTSIDHRGNLLELKCIHKMIHHRDEVRDSACGTVYLGFYEKLDRHLKQTHIGASCQRSAALRTIVSDCNQIDKLATKRTDITVPGRHSSARSDSATSGKVKSLRMFTNDLIGSLMRAASSCSLSSRS